MTPFVGSAGNALNRVILSAVGTVIWGITSIGIGAAQNFAQVGDLAASIASHVSAAFLLAQLQARSSLEISFWHTCVEGAPLQASVA